MMNKRKNESSVSNDEIDLSWFIAELMAHKYWFVAAVVVAMILGVVYIKLTPQVYEASSTILIREDNKHTVDINDFMAGDIFGEPGNIATEKGILASRSVMRQTINELDLGVGYYNTSLFPNISLYRTQPFIVRVDSTVTMNPAFMDVPFKITFGESSGFGLLVEVDEDKLEDYRFEGSFNYDEPITTEYFSIRILRNGDVERNPDYTDYEFIIYTPDAQVNEYISRLRVETPDKDASIIKLAFRDEIAPRARDILNTISQVYIDLDIQDKTSVASLTLKFVDEQLDQTSKVVGDIETEIQQFKEENKTVNLSEESKVALDKMNNIEIQKVKSDIDLQALDNLLEYVSSNRDMAELAPSTMGIPDPLLIELIINYQQLQSKRKSLSYGVKSVTPAIKIIDQQIADTRASLIENIKSIRQNLALQNESLSQQLAEYESQIKNLPEIERELLSIQRKFEVNQNIYIYLLQKKAETSIAKAAAISDNKVLDEAVLAEDPVEPNKKLVISMLLIAGLLIPAIFIFIRKFLKTTISNRDELAKLTDIPILGSIGHSPKGDNLVVHHRPKSGIAESFRSVRTNLQFLGSNGNNKIILITSSIGGEGKSFVTINLAFVFAMQNFKVAIVGLDLRKPKLFPDFNISNDTGVSSYLIGQAGVEEIIQKTSIDNLDLIPSGPVPPNPSELISKPEIGQLFEELSARYDYILVDTPPMGIVSDSLILMKYSHINIYIIRENYSQRSYLQMLNEQFEESKFSNMSIILNDVKYTSTYGTTYGSYGYHSGNGYYDDDYSISENVKRRIFGKSKVKEN